MSEKDLLDVIHKVYDAATETVGWDELAGKIAGLFGRASAELQFVDYTTNEYQSLGAAGFNPLELLAKPEFSDWPQYDPWMAAGALSQGSVIVGTRSLPAEDYRESIFHNEYAKVAGWNWRDVLVSAFNKQGHSLGLFCVYSDWPQTDFDETDADRMSCLQPHLEKALYVWTRLTAVEETVARQSNSLDHMPYGLVLLDNRSHVVYHNKTFRNLIEGESAFKITSSKISLKNDLANRTFQRAIHNAQSDVVENSMGKHNVLFYDDIFTAMRYTIAVVGVCQHKIDFVCQIDRDKPRVLVLISSNNPKLDNQAALCAKLFELTPAERRVAQSLAEGTSLSSIAQTSGTSIHTVRTQLRSIFSKTDTHTQSDLVRLLLTTPISFYSDDANLVENQRCT